jgi:cytochrome c
MNERWIGSFVCVVMCAAPPMMAQERASMAPAELAKSVGCLACHGGDKNAVGPTWAEVAARYKGDDKARERLIAVVRKGGKGNWTRMSHGVPMPPYSPRLTDGDITRLVNWILTPQPGKQ